MAENLGDELRRKRETLVRGIATVVSRMAGALARGESVDRADLGHVCVQLADKCLSDARMQRDHLIAQAEWEAELLAIRTGGLPSRP